MSRIAVCAAIAALFAAPVFAAVADLDTDGDNLASFAEMTVLYPDLTEETYGVIDANGDSFVDDAEMTAAIEADLIPAPAE